MQLQKPTLVHTSDAEYQKVIVTAPSLKLTKEFKKADILLVNSSAEIPKGNTKIIFTTNSSVFESDENAVGAFYWEHGRPKIIFLKSRLSEKNITLSPSFHRYVVEELL